MFHCNKLIGLASELRSCTWLRRLPPQYRQILGNGTALNNWAIICPCCCLATKSCLTLCSPTNCSTPGLLVLHYLPEFAQTYVHWVSDAIQTSHPLSPSSPLALNLSQHQGLFQWVSSWHQVAKVLELQHQSFQLNIQGWFPLGFPFGWYSIPTLISLSKIILDNLLYYASNLIYLCLVINLTYFLSQKFCFKFLPKLHMI